MGWKKSAITSMVMLIFFVNGFSAGEFNTIGGRAAGMGYASVAACDHWSLFNNPAGTGWHRDISAGIYYENRFLAKELGIKTAGISLPFKAGTLGFTFQYYGFSLYSEIKTGLVLGRKFGHHFAAGLQLDYFRIHQGLDLGNRSTVTFGIGLQYRINDHLSLGMHAYNPIPLLLSPGAQERLMPVIRLGLWWQAGELFTTAIEISKDIQSAPSIKGGLEYHLVKPLSIRAGVMTNPTLFTFGFGLNFGGVSFDFASSYHQVLGYSPQVSLFYTLKK